MEHLMADKWPIATGIGSNAANWNGGTKPVPGDVVYADGKTITIDENVTVSQLRTDTRSGGTTGGGFNTSGSVTVNADAYSGTSQCLIVNESGIQNGNSTGGSVTSANGTVLLNGGVQNGNSYAGSVVGSLGTSISKGGVQNGIATGGSVAGTIATQCINGGFHNGDSVGGNGSGAYGTFLTIGGFFYGRAMSGGSYGLRVAVGGIAVVTEASGVSAVSKGVLASGGGQIVVIQKEIGLYAAVIGANTDTTYNNIPFAKPPALSTQAAMRLGNRMSQRGAILS